MNHSGRRAESFSAGSDNNNHQGNGSLLSPDQTRPRSSSSSKALLTMALLEAQSAVQLDNANDIPGALESYQRAVNLLSKVLETSTSPDEQERLRTIHDSYLFRIRLLSTPPTPTTPSGSFAQQSLSALPQPPPLQQPLPPPPRQPNPPRAHSTSVSTVSSITPASSSTTISSQQYGEDSDLLSGNVAQGTVTPGRRTRKQVPVPIQPPPPMSSSMIQSPPEPRPPRQRSDSTSITELGSHGYTRHHTRSHTGGSNYKMTGDLIGTAEQLQIQSQHRVPKVRSRDHLGIPIHLAPTGPLPPTPTTLGAPPSTPPPIPSAYGSQSSTPTHSNPTTPNAVSNNTFYSALSSSPPSKGSSPLVSTNLTSPPPKASLPLASTNLTSPPASPANNSRRISPLAPSHMTQGQIHQQQPESQKPLQSPPNSSPEEEKSNEASQSRFYDEDLVSDEWLPNLATTGFSTSEASLEEDPYPRERATSTSKGSIGGQLEQQIQSKTTKGENTEYDDQNTGDATQQKQGQQMSPQHQRSFSQSSNVSAHHSISSQSRSPLAAPMYNFQQGASSISSLHALDNGSYKRISDSSRSLKESSPLGRSSGGAGATNGNSNASSPSPLPGQVVTRPNNLQQQNSSSKLSSFSNTSSSSPTLDKPWSPSLSNTMHSGTNGGMTLYDVISDDPFSGMSFPLPPPFVDQAPTDPYFRGFWLMRKLEQTMTSGGFLTKRMYVPRTIWYQSLVRLPAADTKISVCQTLITLFNKLSKQGQSGQLNLAIESGPEGDTERGALLKELDALETAATQVQSKLSKKLSFIPRPGKNGLNLTISTNQGYNEDMQGPATGGAASVFGAQSLYGDNQHWNQSDEPPLPTSGTLNYEKSTKKGGVSVGGSAPDANTGGLKGQWKSFSKSVQKSIGNDKIDDTSTYTETMVRLFQASYILESMLRHYSPSPYQLNIQITNKLRRLCDVLSQVICAFVVRDLGELMGKYVKRVGAWVSE
ncbi:hypothetical protein BGZ76_005397 [Entomortierella beljakovae]|nr:hypothetical protein BGZ76_005397 [Entomortierella beljakovae]